MKTTWKNSKDPIGQGQNRSIKAKAGLLRPNV